MRTLIFAVLCAAAVQAGAQERPIAFVGATLIPIEGEVIENGTNPLRPTPFPGTRGKSAALLRAHLVLAQENCAKVADRKLTADKRPPRNLGLEAMCEALDGRRIVHHHTHRHDDVLTVLRLAREFDLRVVLHHVSEADLVAREIAEAGAMASIIHAPASARRLR